MSEDVKKMATDEIDRELKELELKAKRAELQDLRERLAEREEKRITRAQRFKNNGLSLEQGAAATRASQARCNHLKGGNGLDGVVGGMGDDPQHAVLKHQQPWGDLWVRCLRCAKTWKPAAKKSFYFEVDKNGSFKFNSRGQKIQVPITSIYDEIPSNAKFDEEAYQKAMVEYQQACGFNTRNQTSGSLQLRVQSLDGTDAIE